MRRKWAFAPAANDLCVDAIMLGDMSQPQAIQLDTRAAYESLDGSNPYPAFPRGPDERCVNPFANRRGSESWLDPMDQRGHVSGRYQTGDTEKTRQKYLKEV